MKYALSANLTNKQIKENADEIIISIPCDMSLSSFVKKYDIEKIAENFPERIIILDGITTGDLKAKELEDLLQYKNILFSTQFNFILNKVDKQYLDRFFSLEPITTLFELEYYVKELKIKRVVIGGDLGFNLKNYQYLLNKVKVMANPCICNGGLNSFFIRPDDVDFYSQYIDVLFFPIEREYTLFKIYTKDKGWFGKLNEIIIGLESEFNNKYFTDGFADIIFRDIRACCGKRCKEDKCTNCKLLERLSYEAEKIEKERNS